MYGLQQKEMGIWQCAFDTNNLLQLEKKFTVQDGLQSGIYLSIVNDKENNVWAGGYSGITSLKKTNTNFSITNFTSNDGFLSSNYQSIQLFCDSNDTIWVATSSGLTSFYAGSTGIHKKPILNLTAVSLPDTSKKINAFYKNEKTIAELPYNLNAIEFKFKAICLSDPEKINYSYRLMGLPDTSWIFFFHFFE